MYGLVYKLTSPSLKVYIGQTVDFDRRMVEYGYGRCRAQRHLYSAILKYGWDNFTKEVIAPAYSKAELDQLEVDTIALFRADDPSYGYNLSRGGTGGQAGLKHTAASRAKMSAAHRNLPPRSAETRAKISAARRNSQPISEDTRVKMSASHRNPSPETRAKMSAAAKARHASYRLTNTNNTDNN